MTTLRTWSPLLLFAVWAIIGASLVRALWRRAQSQTIIREQSVGIEQQERALQDLEERVREATASYELERRAREELQLQLPEEIVVPVRQ